MKVVIAVLVILMSEAVSANANETEAASCCHGSEATRLINIDTSKQPLLVLTDFYSAYNPSIGRRDTNMSECRLKKVVYKAKATDRYAQFDPHQFAVDYADQEMIRFTFIGPITAGGSVTGWESGFLLPKNLSLIPFSKEKIHHLENGSIVKTTHSYAKDGDEILVNYRTKYGGNSSEKITQIRLKLTNDNQSIIGFETKIIEAPFDPRLEGRVIHHKSCQPVVM